MSPPSTFHWTLIPHLLCESECSYQSLTDESLQLKKHEFTQRKDHFLMALNESEFEKIHAGFFFTPPLLFSSKDKQTPLLSRENLELLFIVSREASEEVLNQYIFWVSSHENVSIDNFLETKKTFEKNNPDTNTFVEYLRLKFIETFLEWDTDWRDKAFDEYIDIQDNDSIDTPSTSTPPLTTLYIQQKMQRFTLTWKLNTEEKKIFQSTLDRLLQLVSSQPDSIVHPFIKKFLTRWEQAHKKTFDDFKIEFDSLLFHIQVMTIPLFLQHHRSPQISLFLKLKRQFKTLFKKRFSNEKECDSLWKKVIFNSYLHSADSQLQKKKLQLCLSLLEKVSQRTKNTFFAFTLTPEQFHEQVQKIYKATITTLTFSEETMQELSLSVDSVDKTACYEGQFTSLMDIFVSLHTKVSTQSVVQSFREDWLITHRLIGQTLYVLKKEGERGLDDLQVHLRPKVFQALSKMGVYSSYMNFRGSLVDTSLTSLEPRIKSFLQLEYPRQAGLDFFIFTFLSEYQHFPYINIRVNGLSVHDQLLSDTMNFLLEKLESTPQSVANVLQLDEETVIMTSPPYFCRYIHWFFRLQKEGSLVLKCQKQKHSSSTQQTLPLTKSSDPPLEQAPSPETPSNDPVEKKLSFEELLLTHESYGIVQESILLLLLKNHSQIPLNQTLQLHFEKLLSYKKEPTQEEFLIEKELLHKCLIASLESQNTLLINVILQKAHICYPHLIDPENKTSFLELMILWLRQKDRHKTIRSQRKNIQFLMNQILSSTDLIYENSSLIFILLFLEGHNCSFELFQSQYKIPLFLYAILACLKKEPENLFITQGVYRITQELLQYDIEPDTDSVKIEEKHLVNMMQLALKEKQRHMLESYQLTVLLLPDQDASFTHHDIHLKAQCNTFVMYYIYFLSKNRKELFSQAHQFPLSNFTDFYQSNMPNRGILFFLKDSNESHDVLYEFYEEETIKASRPNSFLIPIPPFDLRSLLIYVKSLSQFPPYQDTSLQLTHYLKKLHLIRAEPLFEKPLLDILFNETFSPQIDTSFILELSHFIEINSKYLSNHFFETVYKTILDSILQFPKETDHDKKRYKDMIENFIKYFVINITNLFTNKTRIRHFKSSLQFLKHFLPDQQIPPDLFSDLIFYFIHCGEASYLISLFENLDDQTDLNIPTHYPFYDKLKETLLSNPQFFLSLAKEIKTTESPLYLFFQIVMNAVLLQNSKQPLIEPENIYLTTDCLDLSLYTNFTDSPSNLDFIIFLYSAINDIMIGVRPLDPQSPPPIPLALQKNSTTLPITLISILKLLSKNLGSYSGRLGHYIEKRFLPLLALSSFTSFFPPKLIPADLEEYTEEDDLKEFLDELFLKNLVYLTSPEKVEHIYKNIPPDIAYHQSFQVCSDEDIESPPFQTMPSKSFVMIKHLERIFEKPHLYSFFFTLPMIPRQINLRLQQISHLSLQHEDLLCQLLRIYIKHNRGQLSMSILLTAFNSKFSYSLLKKSLIDLILIDNEPLFTDSKDLDDIDFAFLSLKDNLNDFYSTLISIYFEQDKDQFNLIVLHLFSLKSQEKIKDTQLIQIVSKLPSEIQIIFFNKWIPDSINPHHNFFPDNIFDIFETTDTLSTYAQWIQTCYSNDPKLYLKSFIIILYCTYLEKNKNHISSSVFSTLCFNFKNYIFKRFQEIDQTLDLPPITPDYLDQIRNEIELFKFYILKLQLIQISFNLDNKDFKTLISEAIQLILHLDINNYYFFELASEFQNKSILDTFCKQWLFQQKVIHSPQPTSIQNIFNLLDKEQLSSYVQWLQICYPHIPKISTQTFIIQAFLSYLEQPHHILPPITPEVYHDYLKQFVSEKLGQVSSKITSQASSDDYLEQIQEHMSKNSLFPMIQTTLMKTFYPDEDKNENLMKKDDDKIEDEVMSTSFFEALLKLNLDTQTLLNLSCLLPQNIQKIFLQQWLLSLGIDFSPPTFPSHLFQIFPTKELLLTYTKWVLLCYGDHQKVQSQATLILTGLSYSHPILSTQTYEPYLQTIILTQLETLNHFFDKEMHDPVSDIIAQCVDHIYTEIESLTFRLLKEQLFETIGIHHKSTKEIRVDDISDILLSITANFIQQGKKQNDILSYHFSLIKEVYFALDTQKNDDLINLLMPTFLSHLEFFDIDSLTNEDFHFLIFLCLKYDFTKLSTQPQIFNRISQSLEEIKQVLDTDLFETLSLFIDNDEPESDESEEEETGSEPDETFPQNSPSMIPTSPLDSSFSSPLCSLNPIFTLSKQTLSYADLKDARKKMIHLVPDIQSLSADDIPIYFHSLCVSLRHQKLSSLDQVNDVWISHLLYCLLQQTPDQQLAMIRRSLSSLSGYVWASLTLALLRLSQKDSKSCLLFTHLLFLSDHISIIKLMMHYCAKQKHYAFKKNFLIFTFLSMALDIQEPLASRQAQILLSNFYYSISSLEPHSLNQLQEQLTSISNHQYKNSSSKEKYLSFIAQMEQKFSFNAISTNLWQLDPHDSIELYHSFYYRKGLLLILEFFTNFIQNKDSQSTVQQILLSYLTEETTVDLSYDSLVSLIDFTKEGLPSLYQNKLDLLKKEMKVVEDHLLSDSSATLGRSSLLLLQSELNRHPDLYRKRHLNEINFDHWINENKTLLSQLSLQKIFIKEYSSVYSSYNHNKNYEVLATNTIDSQSGHVSIKISSLLKELSLFVKMNTMEYSLFVDFILTTELIQADIKIKKQQTQQKLTLQELYKIEYQSQVLALLFISQSKKISLENLYCILQKLIIRDLSVSYQTDTHSILAYPLERTCLSATFFLANQIEPTFLEVFTLDWDDLIGHPSVLHVPLDKQLTLLSQKGSSILLSA